MYAYTVKTKKENANLLNSDYVYLIGYYIGTRYSAGTVFSYEYDNKFYRNDVSAIKGQNYNHIFDILNNSPQGQRFLVKVSPETPKSASAILVDYPVPDDIALAPAKGWKEIPDWNKEREAGNVLTVPYSPQDAPVELYVSPWYANYVIAALILFVLYLRREDIIRYLKNVFKRNSK